MDPVGGCPGSARVLTAIRTWPEYVRLTLVPLDLSSDYGPAVIIPEATLNGLVLLGLATGLAAALVVAATWRRARLLAVGVLWFMVVVLPVSNLPFATGVILAERTLYLPSVGLALGIAGLAGAVRQERPAWGRGLTAALIVLIAAGAVRTWVRNPSWRTSNTVLNQLVRDHPESYRAQGAIAEQQLREGQVREGMARYRMAVEMAPGHFGLRERYADHLFARGRYADAAQHYDVARRIIPDAPRSHVLYLAALVQVDSLDQALRAAPAILDRFPDDVSAHHQYARALARAGRFDEAALQRRLAIRLTPGAVAWQQWGHLATVELARGDTAAALAALDSATATATDAAALPDLDALADGLAGGDPSALPLW